jgi:predicted PurR-regulated permease PerM
MSEAKLEAYFFTTLFIGVLLLTAQLFLPFVGALALAIVLASLGKPLYDRINKRLERNGVSAFLVVLIVTGAVLVPATMLFFLLVEEVTMIAQAAVHIGSGSLMGQLTALGARIHQFFPVIAPVDIGPFIQTSVENVASYVVTILTSAASAILELFVAIFALYYFLKDGDKFVKTFIQLSPLTDDEDVQIVHKLTAITRSLIRGTFVIAILQGVLMGVGCLLFGIPNPVLWGSVAAIASLIPSVGTGIVTIPAVAYLIGIGDVGNGVGLAIWGFLFVGLVDNILRPHLIGNSVHIHPLFVLLSVLGGIAVFGVAGLLLGPLIFGLLVALSEIYRVKIKEIHKLSE